MTGRFGGSTRPRERRVFERAGRQSPQSGGRPTVRTLTEDEARCRPTAPPRKSRLLAGRASFVPVRRSVSRDAGRHAPPPPDASRERLLPRVPRDLFEADGWRGTCTESRLPALQLCRLDSGLPPARADDGAPLAVGRRTPPGAPRRICRPSSLGALAQAAGACSPSRPSHAAVTESTAGLCTSPSVYAARAAPVRLVTPSLR
jgi:hypothetical protein